MKSGPVLQQLVMQVDPLYHRRSKKQKQKLLKEILAQNIVEILQKVRVSDPVQFRFKMWREYFLNRRRRKEAKTGSQQFNYNLWRLLYEAKQALNFNIIQTTQHETKSFEGISNVIEKSVSVPGTSFWKEQSVSPSTVNISSVNLVASNFDVEKTLEAKMATSTTYTSFVSCLNSACQSESVRALGIAKFYLYEKQDKENPKWEKIILDAKFYDDNLETKIVKWEKLRLIIDVALEQMKKYSSNRDKINELEKKFYIKMKI